MRIEVTTRIVYRLGHTDYTVECGEQDVPDELAEVALGAGWARVLAKAPPANKARKSAPENK